MGGRGLVATGVPATQPVWLLYLKGGILLLSLLLLCFGAWNASLGWWGGGAGGMTIFCAIWNFLWFGGAVALEFYAPHHYYRIAFLIGQILSIIFLLGAWAWSASLASWYGSSTRDIFGTVRTEGNPLHSSLAVCAAFGAITWIAVIVHMVFFIMASVRDDQGISGTTQAELGQVKHEQPQPVPQYAPQPGYPQQQQFVQQQPYATQ